MLRDFPNRQVPAVNRHEMKRPQPGPFAGKLVGQGQAVLAVPVCHCAGHALFRLLFAVEKKSRAATPVAGVHDVSQPGSQTAAGAVQRGDAVPAGLGGSQPHVHLVALLAKREVALGTAARQRDHPRRAVLLGVGRTHPRLDGDLAGAAHGVEYLGRRLVGANERLAAHLERTLGAAYVFRVLDFQVKRLTDAGAILDDAALGQAEIVQRHQAIPAPIGRPRAGRPGQGDQKKTHHKLTEFNPHTLGIDRCFLPI